MRDGSAVLREYELIDIRRAPEPISCRENRQRYSGQGAGSPPVALTYRTGAGRNGQAMDEMRRRQVRPVDRMQGRREEMLRQRRKRQLRRQKVMFVVWAACLIVLSSILLLDRGGALAGELPGTSARTPIAQAPEKISGKLIQGIPAEKYAAHPDWAENFLTPNEYSRPGEALSEVRDVFVHYTANPGTSAAQNRSYFEQQKDVHMASVSAHFIIGYEGEIIQCVPLDEIAYAVAGRNYDSISIECCYTAQDGSFTEETYASLISLLAWLTDVYDLDKDQILRHYDSGGKQCPIYYTENEDKWEQLKEEVAAVR